MKYALLLIFQYKRNYYSENPLNTLPGALSDFDYALLMCKDFGIEPKNITIVTDLPKKYDYYKYYNYRYINYPDCKLVCREISQFIENTLRGIEDFIFKSGGSVTEEDEVFFYISGHGGQIEIEGNKKQGIILTGCNGNGKRYLLSNDLFNILFGKNYISPNGQMIIPVWEKTYSGGKFNFNRDSISVQLSSVITSSERLKFSGNNISHKYRKSYFENRGIPSSTKMLILIDTCHSENMTQFPFFYNYRTSEMELSQASDFNSEDNSLPYCVTIAACQENKKTKSSIVGSEVTRLIYSIFSNNRNTEITIGKLNDYLGISPYFSSSYPIISSTSPNPKSKIPLF